MSVGISSGAYRLILPIENGRSRDETLKTLTVLASFPAPPCAEVPTSLVYEVKDSVSVDPDSRARGAVSASGGLAAGFTVLLTGLLSYGCAWSPVRLFGSGVSVSGLSRPPLLLDDSPDCQLYRLSTSRRFSSQSSR
jgi:hypothetical protein